MNLYLKETGIKNEEIILFLHPEMLSSWIWEQQSITFSNYHCIMPDLPSHGKSQTKNNFTIKNSAKEIINLIEKKSQNKPVHIVGLSLGAQIILEILSEYEDNIETAILVNPLVADYNDSDMFKESLNHVIDSYLPVKSSKFFIKAYIRYYGMPKSNFEKLSSSINKISDSNLKKIMSQTLLFDLDNKIKNKTPLLILAGDKEYDNIKQSAKIIKDKTQNSQAYIVPKMLKLANIINADIFNLILRNYLEEKPLPDNLIKL